MIAVVDIEITSQNPAMPLFPMRAFQNSPSSIRVRNVPKKIGKWQITSIQFVATYPDNTTKTANCVLVGGVWVGTLSGSSIAGYVENGYTIFASGTDENGNAVSNYILGKGDISILESDGQLHPGADIKYVHITEGAPDAPRNGDLWQISGSWYIYQDNQAWPIGDDSGLIEQLSAQLSSKADVACLSAYAKTVDVCSAAIDNLISTKQDNLTIDQISAINSVVDERTTTVKYIDESISSFSIYGLLTNSSIPRISEATELYIGSTVTTMENYTFADCPYLSVVKFSNSIKSIGNRAFNRCISLQTIEIPKTIKDFGVSIFSGCSALTSVVIDDGISAIYEGEFYNCTALAQIEIPNSIQTIGKYAFSGCAITNVTIPENVSNVGSNAFSGCASLTSIIVKGKTMEQAISLLSSANYPVGCEITTWNDASQEWAIDKLSSKADVSSLSAYATKTDATLSSVYSDKPTYGYDWECTPATYNGYPITIQWVDDVIWQPYWQGNPFGSMKGSWTSLSLEWIGDQLSYEIGGLSAYRKRSDVIKYILGTQTDKPILNFNDVQVSAINQIADERMTNIKFDDGTTSSFNWTGLLNQQILWNEGLIDSGGWVKNLESIKIGTAISSLESSLFENCGMLYDVSIPDSVLSIGDGAFRFCTSLSSVRLPSSIKRVGDQLFYYCEHLHDISIPDSVLSIGSEAFQGNTFTKLMLNANNIKAIGANAFAGCYNLTSLIFQDGIMNLIQNSANYPWGITNTDRIKTWNGASQEWVKDQGYGKDFTFANGSVTPFPTRKMKLNPAKVTTYIVNSATASFAIAPQTDVSSVAHEMYFTLVIGTGVTQPITWDSSVDVFKGGSAEAIAPVEGTNIYHIFEYASGHFMVEKII